MKEYPFIFNKHELALIKAALIMLPVTTRLTKREQKTYDDLIGYIRTNIEHFGDYRRT